MNVKRTVMLGVVGGAVAVWLAAAATSTTRTIAPVVPARPNVVDKSGAELAAEIARLHERLRPTRHAASVPRFVPLRGDGRRLVRSAAAASPVAPRAGTAAGRAALRR